MKANQKAELYREAYYWDLMALIRKLKQKYGSEATPVKAATDPIVTGKQIGRAHV